MDCDADATRRIALVGVDLARFRMARLGLISVRGQPWLNLQQQSEDTVRDDRSSVPSRSSRLQNVSFFGLGFHWILLWDNLARSVNFSFAGFAPNAGLKTIQGEM